VVVDVAHGVHGLEALIGVVVAVEDQVDPASDQLGPQVLELSLAGVGAGGGAVGMMEEGQGAALVVAGQVVLEPAHWAEPWAHDGAPAAPQLELSAIACQGPMSKE
jgi:hypothetical protein